MAVGSIQDPDNFCHSGGKKKVVTALCTCQIIFLGETPRNGIAESKLCPLKNFLVDIARLSFQEIVAVSGLTVPPPLRKYLWDLMNQLSFSG